MRKGAIFDADGTLLDSMFIWDSISGRLGHHLLSLNKINANN